MVPGGRERTQREDELQRQVEDDSAQGPVVSAKSPSSAPSMDEWDGHLAAGHAEYRGWCPFCVAAKERARLIDGWKRQATMGIQNFVWTIGHQENITICAQKVAAHESKRCRIQEGIRNGHEDHIAERGYNSIPPCNLVRKSLPIPQAMKMPDAKAAVAKGRDKLKNLRAWQESKGER